jgi:hypothetical protein
MSLVSLTAKSSSRDASEYGEGNRVVHAVSPDVVIAVRLADMLKIYTCMAK